MASQEIAAMLDALMGRHRNAAPGTEIKQPTWEDDGVCPYFLVEYCPHDLFTNTKSDLGPCENIHDDNLKVAFAKAPMSSKKERIMDDFLRMGQRRFYCERQICARRTWRPRAPPCPESRESSAPCGEPRLSRE